MPPSKHNLAAMKRLLAPIALMLLGWAAAAWIATTFHAARQATVAQRQGIDEAQQRLKDVINDLGDTLTIIRNLPEVLAQDAMVTEELRRTGPDVAPSTLELQERRRLWEENQAGRSLTATSTSWPSGWAPMSSGSSMPPATP
ncbi:MAG: hypothetical protein IPP18_00745 [Rhodocyclaceae bacterium]|nr:hypothetical protein [Rhodocyclaceae bacterium]